MRSVVKSRLSAAAQGCLGIETREQSPARSRLAFLHDETAWSEVVAERALLDRLGGNCRVPIGARARRTADKLTSFRGSSYRRPTAAGRSSTCT